MICTGTLSWGDYSLTSDWQWSTGSRWERPPSQTCRHQGGVLVWSSRWTSAACLSPAGLLVFSVPACVSDGLARQRFGGSRFAKLSPGKSCKNKASEWLTCTWITDPFRLSSSGTLNVLLGCCLFISQSHRQALSPSPSLRRFASVHSALGKNMWKGQTSAICIEKTAFQYLTHLIQDGIRLHPQYSAGVSFPLSLVFGS